MEAKTAMTVLQTNRRFSVHFNQLLLFGLLCLTLVTSQGVPPSRCRTLMTSLTCPANQKLENIHESLRVINIHFENITSNLQNQTVDNDTITNLLNVRDNLLNITDVINNTKGIQEDFTDILKNLSPQFDLQHEKVEAFQVALVCLWIDLQNLRNNVTKMSSAQTSGQLTNNLKWSDLVTSIGYLQQHITSTNQNVSLIVDRLEGVEADVTSLKDTLNTLGNARMSGYVQNLTEGGILTDKLSRVKEKLSSKKGKYDYQSTLPHKMNTIPTHDNKRDLDHFHEILEMMEMTDTHLVNVTMATVLMEHELTSLRLTFEERLSKMEDRIKTIEEGASQHSKVPTEPERTTPNITASTCDGSRRHLVGSSCYYVPLVAEADIASTWWDARYLCKRPEVLGPRADLVAIETREEMDALRHLIGNHFGGIEEFWLGASDLEKEGSWRWAMTSDPVTFTNWGQAPYASTAQNCMSMLRGLNWASEPCFYRRHPICELRLDD